MPDKSIRIVFFGTPEYAVPTLRALTADPATDVALVVTQPDRKAGRGHAIEASPIKIAATELGIPLLQPPTLRDESARASLRSVAADLFVVAAYGLIFSQVILDIPRCGCLNLHASLLPKYRGAAPIPAAILMGDARTGVTLMMMERGLDTGPIVASVETAILAEDTTGSLTARLARLGADLAIASIPQLISGILTPVPQPSAATAVRQLTKGDGQINWRRDSVHIERQVRAMWPWPRCWTLLDGQSFQIHAARVVQTAGTRPGTAVGSVTEVDGKPSICCGDGRWLEIETGQIAGGKPLSGEDLVRGRLISDGMQCDAGAEPDFPLIRSIS